MKGIILYQSKYGATKKYADWISEATGFECVETKKANIKEVEKYDIIVLGGGIYAMAFKQIRSHNMKDKLSDIPIFYCRGAWDMDSMSFKDKTLCKMLRKAVSKKDPADYEIWEKAIMDAKTSVIGLIKNISILFSNVFSNFY